MFLFSHILLAASWLFYVFLHSVLATIWFKSVIERTVGKHYFRFYRLSYSLFAFITLAGIMTFQFSIKSSLVLNRSLPLSIFGILLSVAGLAVMAACIKKYFMNLSGVDVLTNKVRGQVLEVNGLHEYVRHPLYSGTLLFIWALFLVFPYLSNLIACTIITVYTFLGIGIEERKLVMEFGESYRVYSSRIPMLIPSIGKLIFSKKKTY